jgi:hypothetical protein
MKKILPIVLIGILVFSGLGLTTVAEKKAKTDNNPPSMPSMSGPGSGSVGEKYKFLLIAEDPEGDNVSYYIEWGDGSSDGWTDYQNSGKTIYIDHIWNTPDYFRIRCKAKDIYGAESDWSDVCIRIIKNKANNLLFLQFLERFPLLK